MGQTGLRDGAAFGSSITPCNYCSDTKDQVRLNGGVESNRAIKLEPFPSPRSQHTQRFLQSAEVGVEEEE